MEPDVNDARLLYNLFSASCQNHFITHYIPQIEFFERLLQSRKLRLRRTDLQGKKDSKDSCYPEANLHLQSTMTKRLNERFNIVEDPKAVIESQNIARRYSYIHCWFNQKQEDSNMWRSFGGDGFGVCIQTTTFKLQNSLKQSEFHLHTEVAPATYTDDAISTLFDSAPFFRKDTQFQDEKEFRVLARIKMEHLPKEPGTEFLAEAPEFQLVEVDLMELQDAVIIGSKVSEEDFIFLKKRIRTLCPSKAVRRSAIGARSL